MLVQLPMWIIRGLILVLVFIDENPLPDVFVLQHRRNGLIKTH